MMRRQGWEKWCSSACPTRRRSRCCRSVAESLEGKVVVNVVAPLSFRKGRAAAVEVAEGSAAEESQVVASEV